MCTMHFQDLFLKINKFEGTMMRDLSTLYENAGTNHGVFLDWWNTTKSLFNI